MAVVAWPPPTPPNGRTNATSQLDNHPTDHNRIADALDTIVAAIGATPWTALPFAANWANFGGVYQTAGYRKIGDVVELRGVVTRSPGAVPPQTIATLPAGYRPPASVVANALQGANLYELTIGTDGTVKVTASPGAAAVTIVSFPGIIRFSTLTPA